MNRLLIILLLLPGLNLHAQRISAPKRLSISDTGLHARMVAMSRELQPVLPRTVSVNYFDGLFRLQIIAGEYQEALNTLDSLRRSMRPGLGSETAGIQYNAYAVTRLGAPQITGAAFSAAYTQNLAEAFSRLSQDARSFFPYYFELDTAKLRQTFESELRSAAASRHLSVATALQLLRSYLAWNTYRQISAPGKAFIEAEHAKRFYASDTTLIQMPDGAQLSAVIARPRAITGPMPVILIYSIYPGPIDLIMAKDAAEHGYAGVVVNTRGKRLSSAPVAPFEHDGEDAWHVIDWISRQSWCNGKIGMYGGSYLGFSQWSAAKNPHPALKTIVPQVAVGIGVDYPALNGIYNSYMLRWIHYVTNNRLTDNAEFSDEARWNKLYVTWYRSGRSFRALDSLDGRPNAIFQRWLDHPVYDAYWQKMIPYEDEFARLNIPVLSITGYFDSDQQGALYYAKEHVSRNPAAKHYLLIGPYDHSGAQYMPRDSVDGYRIDSVARGSIMTTVYGWFNHILKDSALPPNLKDRIVYQPMGTNSWQSAPSFAAMHNDSLRFFLGSGQRLVSSQPDEELMFSRKINYRPKHYSASTQHVVSKKLPPFNGIQFVSDPLPHDMLMNGQLEGEISLRINKQDVDLTATAYELREDGSYFRLSAFSGRASYMRDRSKRALLHPGTEELVPIANADYTSKKLSKGSRIVLVLGVNISPWAQVNYGSGKDVSEETIADGREPLRIEWTGNSRFYLPVLIDKNAAFSGK